MTRPRATDRPTGSATLKVTVEKADDIPTRAMEDNGQLDAALLAAHAAADKTALARLYDEAARHARTSEQAAFYLTHAYVFALDAGLPEAATLQTELAALGRDS